MRIGFDARLYAETGIGRYIRNLLEQFKKIDSSNQYFIFLNSTSYKNFSLPNSNWHKIKVDLKWHSLKEQFLMPKILIRYNLDLVHFPYFNIPLFYKGKYVITVHDLIIDHFPTGRASTLPFLFYKIKWIIYHLIMKKSLSRSSKIFAISQTTKNEIISHYGVTPSKIFVTFDALDQNFVDIKKKYYPKKRYPFDYLLYVGNAYPHKNLENLIKAFSDPEINSRVKLVLAGDDWFFYPRLKNFVNDLNLISSIIFFGKANDEDLIDLYSFSKGLIIPSFMEGFGLPNLEAVFLDKLPIISDIQVFREIWGNDMEYFNPQDNQSIKKSINNLFSLNTDKYNKIIYKAKMRAKKFSWEKTAKETLLQYKEIDDKINGH